MRKLPVIAITILLFQGCASKVEIPFNHAGVVKKDDQVSAEVLKPGQHLVNFGSKVIVYDVSPTDINLEFDFMFSDTSSLGNLRVVIEFTPIVDSLSAFYRKYQDIYVSSTVEQATGNIIREVFFKYKPTDLIKKEFERVIVKAIKTNPAIMNYVEIRKVDIVALRY